MGGVVRFRPERHLPRRARIYIVSLATLLVQAGADVAEATRQAYEAAARGGLVVDTDEAAAAAARAVVKEARRWSR